MKLLTPLLLCFLCLLTGATPWGTKNFPQDHTGDGRTYTYSDTRVSNNGRNVENVQHSYTDNSIHRNNANFAGAKNVVIGSNTVPDGVFHRTEEKPGFFARIWNWLFGGSETLSRQKRWEVGVKSNVRNEHNTWTDNSINMDNANFAGSQNVIIGHGNRAIKRSVPVEEPQEGEELSRQKRWGVEVKSEVINTQSTRTDNSIKMHNADFQRSTNVVIGNGNKVSKRSVENLEGPETSEHEELSRKKRFGGVGVKTNVDVGSIVGVELDMLGKKYKLGNNFGIGTELNMEKLLQTRR